MNFLNLKIDFSNFFRILLRDLKIPNQRCRKPINLHFRFKIHIFASIFSSTEIPKFRFRLALFLRHSKELVCLLDDLYCTRLWCVWEIATYLKLRENPKLTFICMSQRCCGVIMVLVYMVQTATTTAVQESNQYFCSYEEDLRSDCVANHFTSSCFDLTNGFRVKQKPDCFVNPIKAWQNYLSLSVVFVSSVILAAVGFVMGQRHFRNQDRLGKAIAVYDIRQAKCASENDRDLLLRFVNDIFRPSAQNSLTSGAMQENSIADVAPPSEDVVNAGDGGGVAAPSQTNPEQGIDAFNHVVRTTVPRHVSISGIRKFKILPYIVAVLVPLRFYHTDTSIIRDPFHMLKKSFATSIIFPNVVRQL